MSILILSSFLRKQESRLVLAEAGNQNKENVIPAELVPVEGGSRNPGLFPRKRETSNI